MDQFPPADPVSPPFQAAPPASPTAPRGYPVIAWLLIALACAVVVTLNSLDVRGSSSDEKDQLGVVLMEIQGKYMVGAATMQDAELIYATAEDALNTGSIAQRHRFIVLAGELMGREEAVKQLTALDELIERERESRGDDPPIMTLEESYIHHALHRLYLPDEQSDSSELPVDVRDGLASLGYQISDDASIDREFLKRELGWFGELALASQDGGDAALRQKIIGQARVFMFVFIGGVIAAAGAGVLGFAGLITLVVFLFLGKMRNGMNQTSVHPGLYAETFAAWMFLFLLLQIGAGIGGALLPDLAMVIVLFAFFGSLLALAWPVLRGVPWRQVRRDIGWKVDRPAAIEPVVGVAGYLMALPILAVGIGITYVLMTIQQSMKMPGPMFEPAGGPAHPIIEQLAGPDWWPKIMVLVLAAIAAPIVEETMFRGVLYRHLRDGLRGLGIAGSVILATFINSFVFAIIHPQGWVAIPALMSLAIAFSLMREWRGSLIPCMIMHGISNFIVMSALIVALSV